MIATGARIVAAQPADTTRVRETMVVTGSRTKQVIQEAPASMSVITAAEIENSPADDYGDLLRNVPGVNVTQISARDVQIVGRGAAGSLATHQLVLVDGRTIYLDFFGFVMWDFLPTSTREIRQIEVVRGPGSAVWGANALTGVINVITKSPREMRGTHLVAGGGEFDTGYANLTHAGGRGRFAYKLSGGYYITDPFDRPQGFIPGHTTPPNQTTYPPFKNEGTEQPKFDLRMDFDSDPDSRWTLAGGYAGTDGILHSGIGPFDIDPGTFLSYGRLAYDRRALHVQLFSNVLDGDGTNLLTSGVMGRPITFSFESQTYNLEANNSTAAGDRNVFTYGANLRRNKFDLSIAPRADRRDEIGAYVQDEMLLVTRDPLSSEVRWVAGVRIDNIDPIGTVWSPRTSLIVSPYRDHTFRVSFNKAFRAPSVVQNYLETTIVNQVRIPVPMTAGVPFVFPTQARGNPGLHEEELTAYEVGWTGTLRDRVTLGVAAYRNELRGNIDFAPESFYSSADPPPGWPPPPLPMGTPVPPNSFPKSFTYRNIGKILNHGVELSCNVAFTPRVSGFANYSFQDDPEPFGIATGEINQPPRARVNVGGGYDGRTFFGNAHLNYQDDAFWTDVLDARFWGPTKSFTQVNASAGVRLFDSHMTLAVLANNVFDAGVQQHVFGDILRRKVVGELRYTY